MDQIPVNPDSTSDDTTATPSSPSRSISRVADTEVTDATSQATSTQVVEQEISNRLTVDQSIGIRQGQERSFTTDIRNIEQTQQITTANTLLNQTQQTYTTQQSDNPLPTNISPIDRLNQITSKTYVSPKATADATRALQNIQRRCNHKYNLTTRKCEYCGKNRDSHVHD